MGPYTIRITRESDGAVIHKADHATLADLATDWAASGDTIIHSPEFATDMYVVESRNAAGDTIHALYSSDGQTLGAVRDGDEIHELVPGAHAAFMTAKTQKVVEQTIETGSAERVAEIAHDIMLSHMTDKDRAAVYGNHDCAVSKYSAQNWHVIASHAAEEILRLNPEVDGHAALSDLDMRNIEYFNTLNDVALRMADTISRATESNPFTDLANMMTGMEHAE